MQIWLYCLRSEIAPYLSDSGVILRLPSEELLNMSISGVELELELKLELEPEQGTGQEVEVAMKPEQETKAELIPEMNSRC
jgi:hypothetical protein